MTSERVLQEQPLQVLGRLPDSSNNALLCSIAGEDGPIRVVYKPQAGEQPLWDFPSGTLSRREKAAAALDEILGFGLVPTTAWREAGPAGPGTVQEWVDGQIDIGIFAPGQVPTGWVQVVDAETNDGPVVVCHRDDVQTQQMIVFDAIANNADRKGGHLLRTDAGLHGIDHGVTFHEEPKLRTVLWGLIDEPVQVDLLETVQRALPDLERLDQWLTLTEVRATTQRARQLLAAGTFPAPMGHWPALPWPLI
jgi:uncharacterized repeat protein (TIGR03843 family)